MFGCDAAASSTLTDALVQDLKRMVPAPQGGRGAQGHASGPLGRQLHAEHEGSGFGALRNRFALTGLRG